MDPRWKRRLSNRRGQSLPEYAMIIACVALVCVIALIVVSGGANSVFDRVSTELDDPAAAEAGQGSPGGSGDVGSGGSWGGGDND